MLNEALCVCVHRQEEGKKCSGWFFYVSIAGWSAALLRTTLSLGKTSRSSLLNWGQVFKIKMMSCESRKRA